MFKEFSSEMKEQILSKGEIVFEPTIKSNGSAALSSYVRHTILFRYLSGDEDEIGSFYLTIQDGYHYEMNRLEITPNIGQALKLFMLELILKTAMKEASISNASSVRAVCSEPLALDAFLTCRFEIDRFESSVKGRDDIFCGRKVLKRSETHPLVKMASGKA
jgi:hypothetical protein